MPHSPTFTERRLYRNAVVLMGFQSAQGTFVTDFSTALTRQMWAREYVFDPNYEKADEQGTTGTAKKRLEARYVQQQLPIGMMLGAASPESIEWLLRSWGGIWTGVGTLTLPISEEIAEFATLALVENVAIPNPQDLVRVLDMWAHRVTLSMDTGISLLDVQADFAGRDFDRTLLNALGGAGITMPADFDQDIGAVFAPHQFRLFRDPAGDDVSIAIQEIEIILEHGLLHENYNDVLPQVVKEGHTMIKVRMRARWQNETKAISVDSEADVPVFKRFTAEWTSGAKIFKIDMSNVDFVPAPTGWADEDFTEFIVEGEAYLDSSDNYVAITLTP